MKRFRTAVALLAFLVAFFPIPAEGSLFEDDVYIDNIVIVLDASGSMNSKMHHSNESKMAVAKAALLDVLRLVPDSTHIGMLVFSGRGFDNEWIYPLGPRDDAKLSEAINKPIGRGGTPLGEYIKKGADRLLEARNKQHGYGSYRLLIVTDGAAGDPDLVDAYTPEVIARGITMDVIGVNMDSDHTLATKVHSYRRGNDPAALKQAIAEVFAEVSSAGDGGVAEEEAFAILQSIPGELALSILESLSASGNAPIGKNREFGKYMDKHRQWAQTKQQSSSVPQASSPSGSSGTSRKSSSQKSSWETMKTILLIVVIGFIMFLRRFGGSRGR